MRIGGKSSLDATSDITLMILYGPKDLGSNFFDGHLALVASWILADESII